MPFWVVLDHDAILRLATIGEYLGGVALVVLTLYIAYKVVDEYEWDLHKKPDERNPKFMLAIQAISVLVYFGAAPVCAWILGSWCGALIGLALGYVGLPIAYAVLLGIGAWFARRAYRRIRHEITSESD